MHVAALVSRRVDSALRRPVERAGSGTSAALLRREEHRTTPAADRHDPRCAVAGGTARRRLVPAQRPAGLYRTHWSQRRTTLAARSRQQAAVSGYLVPVGARNDSLPGCRGEVVAGVLLVPALG